VWNKNVHLNQKGSTIQTTLCAGPPDTAGGRITDGERLEQGRLQVWEQLLPARPIRYEYTVKQCTTQWHAVIIMPWLHAK